MAAGDEEAARDVLNAIRAEGGTMPASACRSPDTGMHSGRSQKHMKQFSFFLNSQLPPKKQTNKQTLSESKDSTCLGKKSAVPQKPPLPTASPQQGCHATTPREARRARTGAAGCQSRMPANGCSPSPRSARTSPPPKEMYLGGGGS